MATLAMAMALAMVLATALATSLATTVATLTAVITARALEILQLPTAASTSTTACMNQQGKAEEK